MRRRARIWNLHARVDRGDELLLGQHRIPIRPKIGETREIGTVPLPPCDLLYFGHVDVDAGDCKRETHRPIHDVLFRIDLRNTDDMDGSKFCRCWVKLLINRLTVREIALGEGPVVNGNQLSDVVEAQGVIK